MTERERKISFPDAINEMMLVTLEEWRQKPYAAGYAEKMQTCFDLAMKAGCGLKLSLSLDKLDPRDWTGGKDRNLKSLPLNSEITDNLMIITIDSKKEQAKMGIGPYELDTCSYIGDGPPVIAIYDLCHGAVASFSLSEVELITVFEEQNKTNVAGKAKNMFESEPE